MTKEQILDAIKEMSVLELNDLVKAIEEEFGVTAAAPVAVVGGAAAGAALGAAAGAAPFTSLTSTSYAVPFTVTLNFFIFKFLQNVYVYTNL